MKVIFLDVDGVLNTNSTKERTTCKKHQKVRGVEPGKCQILKDIVLSTDSYIVLSTTWREHPEMMPYLWENLGPELKVRYMGDTPILDEQSISFLFTSQPRGVEIAEFLKSHPEITQFVILDDRDDMKPNLDRLVQTSDYKGLTPEIAERVKEMLK